SCASRFEILQANRLGAIIAVVATGHSLWGAVDMGMKDLLKSILIEPGAKCRLSEYDPEDISLCSSKEAAQEEIARDITRLAKLQEMLYAEDRRSVLIILQAMDAGGK